MPIPLMQTSIDYLVRPQADGSDSAAIVQMAEERWGRPEPYLGAARLGRVAVALAEQSIAPWVEPTISHPNLPAIAKAMSRWPAAWEGFQRFVTVFWPLDQPGLNARGCTSGHAVLRSQRVVYVTVYDVEGCREGLLHEWAHLRLEAMGVDLEFHDGRLLRNDNAGLISPIRKDKLRPMSAVLHGFYAWVLMSAGDVIAAQQEGPENVVDFFRTNVAKLEEGILTLNRHARWTEVGAPFGFELIAWAEELVEQMWSFIPEPRDAVRSRHRVWVETQEVSGSPLYGTAD